MSEKFNQANKLVEINLNEDKTLKWRGLHNNQYAAAKRKKDGTPAATATTTTTTAMTTTTVAAATTTTSTTKQRAIARSKSHSADDPSPSINDSNSSSSSSSSSGRIERSGAEWSNNAQRLETTAADHVHQSTKASSTVAATTTTISSTTTTATTTTMTAAAVADKPDAISNTSGKTMDLRPFRRTLRRKQNNTDDANDDVNFVSQVQQQQNNIGKKSIRSRRFGGSGSVSETGSISPKIVDEKPIEPSVTTNTTDSITTRRRGRAKKLENELENANLAPAVATTATTTTTTATAAATIKTERKNSIAQETNECSVVVVAVDNVQATQPPPKLRRSERTLHASISHEPKDVADDHSTIDTVETVKKTRKRTIDERKMPEPKEECIASTDSPVPEVKAERMDEVNGDDATANAKPTSAATTESTNAIEASAAKDEAIAIDDDAGAMAVPRKRGRKPGSKLKSKVDLKVNMTIATRSSPVKKSPRFSSDESPFSYSIPKRDRERNAEQVSKTKDFFFHFFFALEFLNIFISVPLDSIILSLTSRHSSRNSVCHVASNRHRKFWPMRSCVRVSNYKIMRDCRTVVNIWTTKANAVRSVRCQRRRSFRKLHAPNRKM